MNGKGLRRQRVRARMRAMYFRFFEVVAKRQDNVMRLDRLIRTPGMSERKARDFMLSTDRRLRAAVSEEASPK